LPSPRSIPERVRPRAEPGSEATLAPTGQVHPIRVSVAGDAELHRALLGGEPGAAAELWDRFEPLVRRMLDRMLGFSREVDDALQETFLRVFHGARAVRQPEFLKRYVVGVAVRVAYETLRRRRLRSWLRLTSSGELPELEIPELDASAREGVRRLYRILDRLDAETRIVFTLRYLEGYEAQALAEALGVSLATAKRRIQRTTAHVSRLARKDPVLASYLGEGEP
jgi:RNA polymerase sigma-70 factor, ECF subfamily